MSGKILYSKFETEEFTVNNAIKFTNYNFSTKNFDAGVIEINGTHGPLKNNVSNETLYILEGELSVTIDGQTIIAKSGDIVFCPAGKWRTGTGKAKALAICDPPFNENDEEH